MAQPRYINSLSQIGAPGVYVQELAPAQPIKGQQNRTIGLAGQCVRGPVGKFVKCGDYGRFTAVFGGRDRNSGGGAILGHIWAALTAKFWGVLYIVRVAAEDAVQASFDVSDGPNGESTEAFLDLSAHTTHVNSVIEAKAHPGAAGNAITIQLVADGSGTGHLDETAFPAVVFHFAAATTTVTNFESAITASTNLAVKTPGTGANILATPADVLAATHLAGGSQSVLTITAYGPGASGNDIQWKILPATNGDSGYFNLAIKLYGVVTLYQNITIANGLNNTNQIIGNDDATLIRLTKITDGTPYTSVPNEGGADSDGYVFLGQTVANYVSVAGSDGSIADSDYTAVGGPMDILNNTRGINACAVVGSPSSYYESDAAIKTRMGVIVASTSQRVWFASPDDETVEIAAAVTERATFTSGRMSYWFNHEYVIDAVTLETILVQPFLMPMSIISQTSPYIHPGDLDNAQYTQGSQGLFYELGDPDRDTLNGTDDQAGGVSFLNRDLDTNGNDIIIPGNALTCDFSENNEDLDGRYMKDFLLQALAQRLRGDQFKGNTPKNRSSRRAACSGFLTTQSASKGGFYIQSDEQGNNLFSYVNDQTVNTQAQQASGLQFDVLTATLIPKNKWIVLQATVGVDAVIQEQG